jgi:hypothetical protein
MAWQMEVRGGRAVERWRRAGATSLFKRTEVQIAEGKLDERQKEGFKAQAARASKECLTPKTQLVASPWPALRLLTKIATGEAWQQSLSPLHLVLNGRGTEPLWSILACCNRIWPLLFGGPVR